MLGLGAWELTIIFAIILLLFGGKRLPGMASGLGQAIRNFRSALKGDDEISDELEQHKSKKLSE